MCKDKMITKIPEIIIYGAGSMGTVLGAFLEKAGIATDLVSRDKEHIEALKKEGAKIGGTVSFSTLPFDNRDGRSHAMLPDEMQRGTFDAKRLGASLQKKYDIIFLLTKQIDNAATANMLKNYLSPDGVVCTMQNGIPEPALAEILGPEKTLGCMCAWGAIKTAPGKVDLTTKTDGMSFGLGSLSAGQHPMLSTVRDLLEKVCPVTVEQNFIGVRWSKLLINAAFSGMSAVTGYNFGTVAADKRSRDCALHIIKECINVCNAAKVRIEPVQGRDIVRLMDFNNSLQKLKASIILPFAIRKHRAITSSMLRDLDRGRLCEIEDINGVVCAWGRKHGVQTPYNDRIVEIVHSIERGERKYSPQNLKLFKEKL